MGGRARHAVPTRTFSEHARRVLTVCVPLLVVVGMVLIVVGFAGLLGGSAEAPLQYYPVETYTARLVDGPDGARVLGPDEPDPSSRLETSPDGTRFSVPSPLVHAEVTIERPIPMKQGRRRQGYRQPTYDEIAKAGPQVGVTVQLMSETGWTAEKRRHVLDALAPDIAGQSGKLQYAELVRKGGVERPPLPVGSASRDRLVVMCVSAGGFVLGASSLWLAGFCHRMSHRPRRGRALSTPRSAAPASAPAAARTSRTAPR